jgi:hypothetical protein
MKRTNIQGNKIKTGDKVLKYLQPLPTEYAGTFRYVFQIFEQDEDIQLKIKERNNIDYKELISKISKNKFPNGMNFFRSTYDFSVTEKYKELNVKEPYYIPPDINQKIHVQKKSLKFERNRW